MPGSWDVELQALLAAGTITGFALLTHTGAVNSAYGCLAEDLAGEDPASTARASQYHEAFHATCPTHFEACRQHAIVFQQSESSVYAVTRGKKLTVLANYLGPARGVLVTVTCSMPQAIVPVIEGVCDKLRKP